MPYPVDAPRNKHDLLVPGGMENGDNGGFGGGGTASVFTSGDDMFEVLLHKNNPAIDKSIRPLCAAYSYPDAPDPPLSRSLVVVGTVVVDDRNQDGWVRSLLLDDGPHAMRRCTIGVKRISSSSSSSQLAPKDVANSRSFANWVRWLRRTRRAAVVAPDKYGRFALLRPDGNDTPSRGDRDNDDDDDDHSCYAHLYVGQVENVRRRYQARAEARSRRRPSLGASEEPPAPPPPPPRAPPPAPASASPRYEPSTPPWLPSTPPLPPEGTDHGEGPGMLWQPPGAESNGGGGGGSDNLWQPPSATTTGNGDYEEGGGGGFGYGGGGGTNSNDDGPSNNYWNGGEGGGGGGTKKRSRGESHNDPYDDNDNGQRRDPADPAFHRDAGAAAADAFYTGLTRTLETRADSRIYHMRAFNGWVKATQIQELDPQTFVSASRKGGGGGAAGKPLRILDLACGKGGDLGKWVLHPRGIANYVGVDVARGSLRDAALRARAPNLRSKLRRCTFTCADLGSDVPGRYASTTVRAFAEQGSSAKKKPLQKLLSWSLQDEAPGSSGDPEFRMVRGGGISLEDRFDVVSIQFAIHYMMSSRKRARRFFQTVSELLEVGGNLIATTIDARVVVQHLMNLGLDLHFDNDDEINNTTKPKGGFSRTGDDEDDDALIRVGNGACQIRFPMDKVRRIFSKTKKGSEVTDGDPTHNDDLFGLEYTFTLVEGSEHGRGVGDAVNLPEWLTPLPVLTALADEAGLVLEYAHNFHEFYAARSDPRTHAASHGSLYNMKVLNRNGSISPDEWEISRLYVAIKFRKVRESTITLDDDDVEIDGGDNGDVDSDDEADKDSAIPSTSSPPTTVPEPDPATKARLLPMAMMKAKRAIGDEAWRGLSSEEKTRLTDLELRQLASASAAASGQT